MDTLCLYDDKIYSLGGLIYNDFYDAFLKEFYLEEDISHCAENDWMFLNAIMHQVYGHPVPEGKEVQDSINPPYYTWHPVAECYQISQEFNSNLGQAIQYIYRSGCPGFTKSEDTTEDLLKAIRFLEFEVERLKEVASVME